MYSEREMALKLLGWTKKNEDGETQMFSFAAALCKISTFKTH